MRQKARRITSKVELKKAIAYLARDDHEGLKATARAIAANVHRRRLNRQAFCVYEDDKYDAKGKRLKTGTSQLYGAYVTVERLDGRL